MSREWTDNQKKAIKARGMQVLVSAAAGSGKTAVLTERVKNILCDTTEKCSVSEILVVTFTRAAATEMRERIYKALNNASISDKANNSYLREQMTLLPTADICTMDSFCSKLVKENFHLADVGADFTILDEKDNARLMNEAIGQVMDELYEGNNEAFEELSKMFLNERDDSELEKVISSVYKYSRSYPSPFLWLDSIADSFSPEKTPDETCWAEYIYKHIELLTDFYIKRLKRCIAIIEDDGNFHPNYLPRFTNSLEKLELLGERASVRDWDGMVGVINEGIIVKPYAKNTKCDPDAKVLVSGVFDDFEDDIKSLEKRTLPTADEHKADCKRLYPMVRILCDAVKRLTEILDEEKKKRNSYTFDDILHKCIDLLVICNENGWEKTALAKDLTEKYKEILIDEYQDTNEAQNIIFEAVSRDKSNLYVVGDVKQSIYRFRLASPELFMSLKKTLGDFSDGETKPSQITLEKNFRSRVGVTEAVNYVFERIMSEDVGEIQYDEKEFLYAGAEYSDKPEPDTTLLLIETGNEEDEDSEAENPVTEPQAIAEYIQKTVSSGVLVKGEAGERAVNWGDFCILLRSTKTKAPLYAEALKNLGIPVNTSLDGEVKEYKEIQFLLSLMRVINNPLIDIPLIAVMMSPVFGFTPDELANIRLVEKKTDLFVCLQKSADSSEKIKNFLDKLQVYRNMAAAYPINEFVRFVVEDTAVSDIYGAVGISEQRKANVNGFIKLADDFSESGRNGLNDFVRYIDNAEENEGIKSTGFSADENSVKIMSIHKSKGLEFPYVIVADCSKGFNKRDSYGALTVAKETGLGIKVRDDENFTRYHSVSSAATEKAILFGSISEELRVLYVALTRAKEHLVFSCDISAKSLKKKIKLNNIFSLDANGKLHPYSVFKASSMSEWLLTCFARHRDCGIIRTAVEMEPQCFNDDVKFSFNSVLIDKSEEASEDCEDEGNVVAEPVDNDLLSSIKENLGYSYPYDYKGITAKRTASSMEERAVKKEYFATRKPTFIKKRLSGAERGTAIHKFLELCDFNKAFESIDAEKQRLFDAGLISNDELSVIDDNGIKAFLDAPVGKRLLACEKVYKEYEFAILKNAEEIYDDIPEYAKGEQIVIQGKLDCAFEENGGIVLVDYKTDNITDEKQFESIYSGQLEIYADAVSQCTGLSVKEIYIYSFKLNKFIRIG